MLPTHYQTLGVRPDATPEQIREGLRQRTREFYLGNNLSPEEAAAWLRSLRAAYDILSDPHKRAEYDALPRPEAEPSERGPGDTESIEQLKRQIAAKDVELVQLRQQREEYHQMVHALLREVEPVDLSEDWLKEPEGTPIADILADYDRRRKG